MSHPEQNNLQQPEAVSDREKNRQARMARSKGMIVEYADADAEMKAQMDRLMDPIDANPDSFEAILNFGHEPLKKLGDISDNLMRVQASYDEQVNVFGDVFSKVEGGIKGMGFDKLGDKTRKLYEGMKDTTVTGTEKIGKLLGSIADIVSGKAAKRTAHEKAIKEIQEQLPSMFLQMIKLLKDLEGTQKGSAAVKQVAMELGRAQVDALREISVYIGCSSEVLQRYKTVYIPECQDTYNETQDPLHEERLKIVMKRESDFVDQINALTRSRGASANTASQIRQIVDTMEEQIKTVHRFLHNHQHEWKAMLAAAGLAGSSMKIANTLKKAGDFGDQILDNTTKMMEDAHKMMLEQKSRGVVDPTKLIESMQRMQKMIEDENRNSQERRKQLEESTKRLRDETDKLIEARDSREKLRLKQLEEAKPKEEAKPAAPVNDNQIAAPEAVAPQKKTGNDLSGI